MNILVQQIPNFLTEKDEFLLNNEKINPNNGTVTGTLQAGYNILELKNLIFPDVRHAELKFSTLTTDYPGMGYKVDYCTYTYSPTKN